MIVTKFLGQWCSYECKVRNKESIYIAEPEEGAEFRDVSRGLHDLDSIARFEETCRHPGITNCPDILLEFGGRSIFVASTWDLYLLESSGWPWGESCASQPFYRILWYRQSIRFRTSIGPSWVHIDCAWKSAWGVGKYKRHVGESEKLWCETNEGLGDPAHRSWSANNRSFRLYSRALKIFDSDNVSIHSSLRGIN